MNIHSMRGFTLTEIMIFLAVAGAGFAGTFNYHVSDYVVYTGPQAQEVYDDHVLQINEALTPKCALEGVVDLYGIEALTSLQEGIELLTPVCAEQVIPPLIDSRLKVCAADPNDLYAQRRCTRNARVLGYKVFRTGSGDNRLPDYIRNGTVSCNTQYHVACPETTEVDEAFDDVSSELDSGSSP